MSFLPLLLIGPTLLVLAGLYWFFPRSLATTAPRRAFDVVALLLAFAVAMGLAAFGLAAPSAAHVDALGRHAGAIWPQVIAIVYAYAGFCLVLMLAAWLRQRWWGK